MESSPINTNYQVEAVGIAKHVSTVCDDDSDIIIDLFYFFLFVEE